MIDIYELEKFGVSKLSQVFSNDIQTISNELVYPILQIITSFILTISIITYITIEIPRITIIVASIYIILYYIFVKSSKRIIRKNSSIIAKLRKFGLANAKGDWICFLDSDNLLCHSRLEIILKNINKFPKS